MLVGKHSAQWALDDVLIGMNDSSRTGFQDKFDGTTPLRHNWYRVQGGEVTVDCLSLDTALTFNSVAIDSESLHRQIHLGLVIVSIGPRSRSRLSEAAVFVINSSVSAC